MNAATYTTDGILDDLKKKRGYSYEDEVRVYFQILCIM